MTGKETIAVGSVGVTREFIGGFGREVSHAASLDELLRRLERAISTWRPSAAPCWPTRTGS